ncbi:hypothetical protein CEXT_237671 [Caerostris extrusa]|uniref:Uncharacterized protein n=1 Tax=Caerostris extrusa TaxID=172846 RepID=A0AAV4RNI4_CAEEX|nr:hypothetical protein CEXT_237671 [Caerostris extrusa]
MIYITLDDARNFTELLSLPCEYQWEIALIKRDLQAGHLPWTPSIVQNADWSEHYSDGDNFIQSVSLETWFCVVKTEADWRILAALPPLGVSLEKWLGVVKTETDWWILAALPHLVSGQRDISTRKWIIRYRIESWDFLYLRSERKTTRRLVSVRC